MTEQQLTFDDIRVNLTQDEVATLGMLKKFPLMDKGSQVRLRKKVNNLRRSSEYFSKAFDMSIGNLMVQAKPSQNSSLLGSMKDVLTHPFTAVKAKIGATLLKRRNKAPQILTHPHPILNSVAEEWDFEKNSKAELLAIIRKMGAALRGTSYGDRLGIAAPQIGISKRIFVCQGAVCINPTWTPPAHDEKVSGIEACYSVPDKSFKVLRSKYGWARWQSVDGKYREYKLKGRDAVIYQHELSHLDGKCCIDLGTECQMPKA